MVEFAEVTRVAAEQGKQRAEYEALCDRQLSAIQAALEARVRAGGGQVTVTPQKESLQHGARMAHVEFHFPGDPVFPPAFSRMSSWFGVRVFLGGPAFELRGPSFAGVVDSADEAVDILLSKLVETMHEETRKYRGED